MGVRASRSYAPIPDLLGRFFTAEGIDQKWCGDLTEMTPVAYEQALADRADQATQAA